MSIWNRLFSRSSRSVSSPIGPCRGLGMELLEGRDMPSAVVFVGGWGASSYQYSSQGPSHLDLRSAESPLKPTTRAGDYSAIVFVGGWGSSL